MQKSKEVLENLYCDKRLTTYEIAEMYSVSRGTIAKWLKSYGIQIVNQKRKFELLKKKPFSKEQKDFVIGTLLGDGCIAKHGNLHRLVCGQCEKQKEFLMWKKAIMGNFVNKVNKRIDRRGNSTMYTFNSISHQEFKPLYNLFYENNKKIVRPELINLITPFGIAIWIMDDGSLNKEVNMRIATDSFTYSEHLILKDLFKTFGINAKIGGYKRNGKEYHYLSFNKRNSILLTMLTQEYFVDSMKYKLIAPQRLHA